MEGTTVPVVGELLYGRKAYRVRDYDRTHLDRVAKAATELEAVRAELVNAIGMARKADVPLRAIADAKLSHEQARRIAKRAAP